MDILDEIKQTWLSASLETLHSSDAILKTIKQYRQKQMRRRIGVLLFTVILFVTMIWVLVDYESQFISTRVGEALMFMALFIILSIGLKALKRTTAFNVYTNEAFLQHLKQEQFRLMEFQKRTQVIGFGFASAGLLLYMYEGVYDDSYRFIIGYSLVIIWIAVMWFIVRPLSFRRKNIILTKKIESLEKISAQLREP